MNSEKFNIELSANAVKMRTELDKVNKDFEKLKGKVDKADKTSADFTATTKKVGGAIALVGTALVAATAALVSYATVQGRAIRETEALANMAGLTVEEFQKLSFVMGTTGITGEKFGDILKDVQERIGDFIATGGGPFQDLADVLGLTKDEAFKLAQEFEKMNGQDVIQAIVTKMQTAGKSTQQMSFALEGLATNATRLIPLLKDSGKAAEDLGKQFDSIDTPLSDEEREQFTKLAANVDLAQAAFVNFINHAIGPFLPAINSATQAFANFFSASAKRDEIDSFIDGEKILDDVKDLNEVQRLLAGTESLISASERSIQSLIDRGLTPKENGGIKEQKHALEEFKFHLQERIEALKYAQEEESKIEQASAVKTANTADQDQSKLESIQDRFKSEMELLEEKYEEEKAILDRAVLDEVERNELKLELKQELEENIASTSAEARELELAETERMLAEKAKLEYKAGKVKTQLEDSIAKNGISLLKMMAGESKAAALVALGIQKAQALSANATATLSGSLLAFSSQLVPGDPTSIARAEAAKQYTMGLGSINAGLIAATGLMEAGSITGGGGGGSFGGGGSGGETASTEQPDQNFSDQGVSVTDISGGESSTQRMTLEFSDEVIDVIARKIDIAKGDNRV